MMRSIDFLGHTVRNLPYGRAVVTTKLVRDNNHSGIVTALLKGGQIAHSNRNLFKYSYRTQYGQPFQTLADHMLKLGCITEAMHAAYRKDVDAKYEASRRGEDAAEVLDKLAALKVTAPPALVLALNNLHDAGKRAGRGL